jgi:SAM-dependent methyltransferase
MLKDKKFRVPRIWSNRELEKFAHLFSGKGVNVSGWKDVDKEGKKYRDYFSNISEYWITNYKSEARGFQGDQENEIFLDLEEDLDESMYSKFDVVFNHTVLEHIFDVNKAFENICKLSNDIVIVVVPFLQEQHAEYGDYWRFTPLAVEKLFQKNNMDLIYINYNDASDDSIYIFAIGTKNKDKWENINYDSENQINNIKNFMLGTKAIQNSTFFRLLRFLKLTS